jgi:PAXNEB protein
MEAIDDCSIDVSHSLHEVSAWSDSDRRASMRESKAAMAGPEAIHELLDSLPSNINFQQEQRNLNVGTGASANLLLQTLAEEQDDEENDEAQNAEEGLVVAWQYRRDVQQERLGLPTTNMERRNVAGGPKAVYCHSYNLQGRLKNQMDIYSSVSLIPMDSKKSQDSPPHSGITLYQQLVSATQSSLQHGSEGNGSVARILLYHPDMDLCSFALPLFLCYVRKHKLPVVILVIPATASSTDREALINVRRCSDVVIATESFTMRKQYPPPAEFRHLHGLLHITRLSTMTQSTISGHFADRSLQRSPAAVRYGLHRDRRKLNISLLHIPPEDYAADGGSVSCGAVRSGAGRPSGSLATITGGCGGAAGQSLLDF